MITYRQATKEDYPAIAQLHAKSWVENYHTDFKAEYLAGPVFKDRLEVWASRFEKTNEQQFVMLAENKQQLCGFVCLYLDIDVEWGTLIDNLHVHSTIKEQGIGRTLMKNAADYIAEHTKHSKYFLWVLDSNKKAIEFYKKVGGNLADTTLFDNPGGGQSIARRVVWSLDITS